MPKSSIERRHRGPGLAGLPVLALMTLSFAALAAFGIGPHTGRYRTLTVLSASMRPTIPEGSVVVVTPVPLSQVEVGDVITYQIPVEDRRVVTHRVVEVVERGDRPVVRTRGDASDSPDPWLARLSDGPAWKARAVIPWIGHPLGALRRGWIRGLLAALPLLALLAWLGEIWARPGPARTTPAPVPTPAPASASALTGG